MKKNVKHINESQLRDIVAESVKKVLREMNEGTITIGSPEDGRGYHVTIALDSLGPYAEFDVYGVGTDAQAAVDAAVDYLDKQGQTGYFCDDDEMTQEYPDDYITAGNYCHQLRSDLIHIEPIGGLNESSVKKVLREMNEKDWRQFAEKAIQYAQRGDYANASKYDNMAASALKEKYGLGDSQFETNFDDYKGKQQYYRSHSLGSQDPYDGTPVDTYSKSLDGNTDRSWKRTSGLLPKDAENDLNDYFGS